MQNLDGGSEFAISLRTGPLAVLRKVLGKQSCLWISLGSEEAGNINYISLRGHAGLVHLKSKKARKILGPKTHFKRIVYLGHFAHHLFSSLLSTTPWLLWRPCQPVWITKKLTPSQKWPTRTQVLELRPQDLEPLYQDPHCILVASSLMKMQRMGMQRMRI